MPRYFFDIVDGQDLPDGLGSEHADLKAATLEAIRLSGEVLREMPDRFWSAENWRMTVSDANRVPLFMLNFIAQNLTESAQNLRLAAGTPDQLLLQRPTIT